MDKATEVRIKKQSNKYSALLAAIICGCVIGGTYSSLLSYAALLLSVVAFVVLSEEDSICLLMLLMPFANIFKASPTSQSFFTYLILFYVLWYLFKKRQINASFLLRFVFLLVFLVVQMIMSINLLRTVKFVANILLVYLAVNGDANEDNKRIYLYYILGMIISSAVAAFGVIPNLENYVGTKDLGYDYEELARFAGLYADPNYYSVNIIISLCLVVILRYKKQMRTIPALLFAAVLVTFAIMTYSKSAFLMLLLPLLMLLYSQIRSRKYFISVVLSLVAIVLVSSVLAGRIEAFNTILLRLLGDDGGSLTTGRDVLWANYIGYLGESWWTAVVGGGFNAPLVENRAAHNTYIDLIYYLGLTGTVLLGSTFYAVIKLIPTPQKRNLLNYSVFLCIMAMYFFLSELFYFDWAFHIIIAVRILKTNMNQNLRGGKCEKVSV